MLRRISKVETIKVNDITLSSVLQIGDTNHLSPTSKALAVKREYPLFFDDEGRFEDYSIFTREIPQPTITEKVNMRVENVCPIIHVDHINVNSISAASVVQIGSAQTINTEVRVKHIRHLIGE
jgi:spore germination protein PE